LTRARPEKRLQSQLAAALVGAALAIALPSAGLLAQAPKTEAKTEANKAPANKPQPPKTPEEAKKTLETKQRELENVKQRTKALQGDVEAISAEREGLNVRLLETAALIKKSEGDLTTIEARLAELQAQEKVIKGSLSQRHGQIAKLLAALQRMGRNPPPVLITQREDALKMVRSAMLLASAFPELGTQARALAARLNELVRVMTESRTQGDRLRSEMTRLTDARTRLSGLLEEKKASLEQRQTELKHMRTAAAQISASVTDLNQLIARLDQAVKDHTGLGAYDKEREGAKDAAPGDSAPPGQKGLDVVELAPGTTLGSPGRIKPEIPFAEAKGRLPLPAQGRQVLAFGEKTQYGGQSKGIVLETRQGAQVTSPCDGWIVYAGEFRSYGQLLIINAGGGYHVLLAGLSQIDVQPGQFVLAAEPVGTMTGWSQQAQPASITSAPVLYVEFRKEGAPIDPDPWWVPGHQKVQG
jgi:septal ring factor EnvC (AmiA/AmiB activator)